MGACPLAFGLGLGGPVVCGVWCVVWGWAWFGLGLSVGFVCGGDGCWVWLLSGGGWALWEMGMWVSVVSVMWSVWVGGGGVGALDLVFGCWAGVVVWLCVWVLVVGVCWGLGVCVCVAVG